MTGPTTLAAVLADLTDTESVIALAYVASDDEDPNPDLRAVGHAFPRGDGWRFEPTADDWEACALHDLIPPTGTDVLFEIVSAPAMGADRFEISDGGLFRDAGGAWVAQFWGSPPLPLGADR